MDAIVTAHFEMFHRILHFRIDIMDWNLGFVRTKSGGGITVDLGPLHLGYSNVDKVQQYFKELLDKELNNEFDLSREIGEVGQNDESGGENRIIH
jgi:hypothetical protein